MPNFSLAPGIRHDERHDLETVASIAARIVRGILTGPPAATRLRARGVATFGERRGSSPSGYERRRLSAVFTSRSGIAAVETAIAIPILVTLFMGAADLSVFQYKQARLAFVAEEAARGWGTGKIADPVSWATAQADAMGIEGAVFAVPRAGCVTGTLLARPYGYVLGETTLEAAACAP